ncbi:MAG TPA: SOS response-associated peptidase [Ktedonobacterales bacterium]|nr:SOS response-associated peptidase [Ktedonobacterales bacterium]
MCGRYVLAEIAALGERFNAADDVPSVTPRYNVAPTQTMPVVVKHSPNSLVLMRWGLIPSWAKDGKSEQLLINARAETLSQKRMFSKLLSSQRCLVPASGFYEWQQAAGGKIPHYITLKDEPIFAFAGLYEHGTDDQGADVYSYTIITTEPNELMASIHNRMPVILSRDDEAFWLNPDETEAARLLPLLKPYPAEKMEATPVSRAVNNVRNDGPTLLQQV